MILLSIFLKICKKRDFLKNFVYDHLKQILDGLSAGAYCKTNAWLEWNCQENAAAICAENVRYCDISSQCNSLLQALQTSKNMSKAFGLTHLPSEKANLNALAEAYRNAESWDTRRQVLSMLSDVANYSIVSEYIPEITRYRYNMEEVLQYL